jgi:hypothetical protein
MSNPYDVERSFPVVHVHDAIPEGADAVVELTQAALNEAGRADGTFDGATVEGDAAAVQRLLTLLDREPSPFYMHLK